MTQTLAIRTPDVVSTTSRTFPKQGVFNLKITKNGAFDTVEIWFRCEASNITLELAGASFQSTAEVSGVKIVPPTPTVISGSTLTLTSGVTQYMKIKLNDDISVAHLRCSYTAKSRNATVAGGNISGQAFVDYSKIPYITTSLERMFITYPVKTDLTKWDTASVTSLRDTFSDNITFNQPIGNWDVSNVTTMSATFRASSFNQPIGNWDVSNVINMGSTFSNASLFNQDLSNWDVSNVTSMASMFSFASSFNQPIGNWDISNVISMDSMLRNASSFNQDLSNWAAKFNVDVSLDLIFRAATWGTTNYDKFLNALWTDINTTRPQAWALRTVPKLLGMGSSKYSAASAVARDSLVSNGWTITDGGLAE